MRYSLPASIKQYCFILLIVPLIPLSGFSQTEFTTWGNITGIRIDNQLMAFRSSLVLVDQNSEERATRKERQRIGFKREQGKKIFSYAMDSILWKETLHSYQKESTVVQIDFSSTVDTLINGAYFRIELPEEFGSDTEFAINTPSQFPLAEINKSFDGADYKAPSTSVKVTSPTRELNILFEKPTEVSIRALDSIHPKIELNFGLASGQIPAHTQYSNTFTISASGVIDTSPIELEVFPDQLGEKFDGIGGNFRLQNPRMDPQVIDYSLDNLRVSWSRVEMPWRQWHPDHSQNPIEEAKNGNLHPKVRDAMEMAQRLDKMGIPVILAAWFPPDWAIIGERVRGAHPDGTRGNALDQSKKMAIYKSITDYIVYLEEAYGVETVMFSFNESDLGIDVRQTAEEHNVLIKELGTYFRSRGVDTKFLLGDTADANGWEFTTIASTDPKTRPYIGGVSFHSWRGWTDENLLKWSDISKRVDVPLFVGEGSIDAGAWRYPQIFEEPTYALDEIDVYLKILNISQPLTILQWQLTSDYSPMSGGGIFGNDSQDLYPTQRFFNLKQLGSTPKGLQAIPITSSEDLVTPAAFISTRKNKLAIHLVNKGATRNATITGIPNRIKRLKVFTTNQEKSYETTKTIPVRNGSALLELEGASFISLIDD
ncbi:hypothetical protein [Flagellimonas crocea]|uniref:hypothetical protein n=1 Tax=Flagellimonas crocea TaxID=3067311 RepID=UPI00296ED2B1|nr:hypothetical protein [Muricauda sp. DH64]